MLSEVTKARVLMARDEFNRGSISKERLQRVLEKSKFMMLYLAYQQASVFGRID